MTADELAGRIVRYGDLRPCKTAFIDAHTPGSDQKENFTIIGGGVSESADQFVHLDLTPGFNIGAAGQPPKCRNSLHTHRTAEVFFVLHGRWRFFWGRYGDAGEVVLNEGDIIDIPTGMFRGFENVGNDYGMLMAVLGGDDAGGGVVWAPEVIEDAKDHGLILGDDGKLYDSKKGESVPANVAPMQAMPESSLTKLIEPNTQDVVTEFVARYWDLMALSDRQAAKVIGADALIVDRPGFEVDFLSRASFGDTPQLSIADEVLMPVKGHWRLTLGEVSTVLNPGDTCALPEGLEYRLGPAMSGELSMYRIRATADGAGPTLAR